MGKEKNVSRNVRGVVCTLLGGVSWGFSGACGQFLFSNYGLDTRWLTSVRMLSAGAILCALSLLKHRDSLKKLCRNGSDLFLLVMFAVFGLVGSQYTYLNAISYSNAGTATVLQYTGPVMVLVYLCLKNRKLPQKREVAAIILAFAGTFLLATHGNIRQMALTPPALIWGLVSAIGLACYTLLPVRLISRYGSIPVAGCGMIVGGVLMTLVMQAWTIPVSLDLAGVAAVAAMCLIGSVVAYTLYLQGVGDIGSARASMLASVEPVSATILSVFWLGSPFTPMDALGFVMILATVFLLAKKDKEETINKGE